MASDDLEREEVARLVNELAPERRVPTPGRRWTNARLLMPERPATAPRRTLALPWDFHVPAWPSFRIPTLTAPQWNVLTARMWVGLGVVFSAAMLYWPYAHASSWGLLLYLCAVALVIVSGVWGARLTWDARVGGAHTIAISVMVWGILLGAVELMPLFGSQH